MKSIDERQKLVYLGVGIILFTSLAMVVSMYITNGILDEKLTEEKIKNEFLLSEKLALFKEIESNNINNQSLHKLKYKLESTIKQINNIIDLKEVELTRLAKENGKVNKLKRQIVELKKLKKEQTDKLIALDETISKTKANNNSLNQSLVEATEENKQLTSNLELLRLIAADNLVLKTANKRGKPTIVAKQTKTMKVNFKAPDDILRTISFKLIKPDGTIVKDDNDIAINVINEDTEELFASLQKGSSKTAKKIEMTYEPKEKLTTGVYKVEIYNKGIYITSCNVNLR